MSKEFYLYPHSLLLFSLYISHPSDIILYQPPTQNQLKALDDYHLVKELGKIH